MSFLSAVDTRPRRPSPAADLRSGSGRPAYDPQIARQGLIARGERPIGGASSPGALARRRIVLYVFLAWLVPMLMVAAQGPAHPSAAQLSWAHDFEMHARGLIAVPLLILADRSLDLRIAIITRAIVSMRIVRGKGLGGLALAVAECRQIVGHPLVDLVLVAAAYGTASHWVGLHRPAESWMFEGGDGSSGMTLAGQWERLVALPIYLFLVLRWGWRWIALALFFYRITKLRMHLVPTHADLCGGIGFFSDAPLAFAWVVAALAAVASGNWLRALLYGGVQGSSLLSSVDTLVVLSVVAACAPLAVFIPRLSRLKFRALRRYGAVVADHGREVGHKWLTVREPVGGEASTMADLNGVYTSIRQLRVVPVRTSTLIAVLAAAALPLLPVLVRILSIHWIATSVGPALL